VAQTYAEALLANPDFQTWDAAAHAETTVIAETDAV
jgi:hypothetical protein